MNKVYKVIWSKVRGCYVVVSEIAKSGGKTKARHEKKSSHGGLLVAAALAASVYGAGESGHAEAATTVAEGDGAAATGTNSIAIGINAKADQQDAIAIGTSAQATAQGAIAVGKNAVAAGQGALVIGEHNSATGQNAVAFGGGYGKNEKGNTASAVASVAFGENTVAKAEGAVAFGYGTQAGSDKTDSNGKNYGQNAVAFGNGTKALGGRSLAFGERTLAEYTNSVAFGADTQARSNGATAFGSRTRAMAQYSTAFGNRAVAAGNYATAFGTDTLAGVKTDSSGAMLLTNGTKIDANGNVAYMDANGNTYAVKNFQNVKNGQPSGETHDYVVVKGTDGNNYIQDYHGDIHAVTLTTQADGTIVATASTDILKNVTLQTAEATSTAGYDFVGYDNATAFGESTKAINKNATALGKNSVASGENSLAFGEGSTASGNNSVAGLGGTASTANSIAIGKDTKANNTTENAVSVAIGQNAEASGAQSLAIGFGNITEQKADTTTTTGSKNYPVNNTAATAKGAIAIGINTASKGEHSVAMGSYTDAAKDSSVAIGFDTHTLSDSTVAIGSGTQARGRYSVAMGLSSVAGTETNNANNPLDGGGSVAIGYAASAEATRSIAIGTGASAYENEFTTAIGDSATASQKGSVAVGAGSNATRAAGNMEDNTTYLAAYRSPANVTSETDATKKATWVATEGAVSVGGNTKYWDYDANGNKVKKTAYLTRQITNVAAGSADTDAVNVAQLKAAGVTVTSKDNSVGITTTTDTTDYHTNYDLKVATATLSTSNGTVTNTNPKGADGTTENKNAYVTGDSVADAINKSGFTLTTSASAGTVSGTSSELINPGETVTLDAGKNIALTQAQNKITVALADDVQAQTVTVKGKDGKDGQIGITGKDGKDGTVTTIIKTVGKNGTDGTDGKPGVDGTNITRVVYQDGKDGEAGTTTHTVATLDDGQKYAGDNYVAAKDTAAEQNVIAKKLNERLDIKGGADKANLTDKNIGVNAVDGVLKVQLAKDLTDLNSVTTGDTVMNSNGLTINKAGNVGDKTITINKTTVSLADNQVTNMGSGADGKDDNGKPTYNTLNNGANIGDVKNIANQTATDLTAKGLDFVGNNTDVTVHRDLGTKLTIQGEGKKDDANYSGENLKVIGDANGSLTIKMDKDITGDSVTLGKDGKDGANGVDGRLIIKNGKDGKDGADAGIHVIKGEAGVKGKDGETITRIVYNDGKDGKNGTDYTLATTEDGLKFKGDDDTVIAKKLNEQLDIIGGATGDLTDKNIAVKSTTDGKLKIQLAKDLTDLNSVTAGDTVMNSSGLTINNAGKTGNKTITINKTTVSFGGNQVTNMGSGSDGKDADGKPTYNTDTNGANIGDVKNIADARKTTVKSTDGTVKVENKSTDANHYDYDLSVDYSKAAGNLNLNYTGDNGSKGSNKLSDSVAFNGTANQIVTKAENGKVTFALADDVKTQTVTVTGKDGRDGQIGLTGKDGKDGTVTTIIRTVGKNGTDGKNGTPGVNGTDGITRITYQDGKDGEAGTTTHTVATLDDGLKFKGDTGDVVTRKLNTQLDVTGGQTDKNKLTATTDGNIGVVSTAAADEKSNGKLEIRLAKDLKGLNTVAAGSDSVFGKQEVTNTKGDKENGDYVTGLDNLIWNGDTYVSGRAATEDQLFAVYGKASQHTVVQVNNGTAAPDTKGTYSTGGNLQIKETVDANGKATYDIKMSDNLSVGKAGQDGKDGSIAVNGQNGSGVTLNGQDGSIGLKGENGANGLTIKGQQGAAGVNGKDGENITRVVYNDGKDGKDGKNYTLATTEDGLKFKGDDGKTITKALNETLDVVGGVTDATKLTNDNIGVVNDGGKLTVKLSKDINLGQNGSIKAGSTTINADGVSTNQVKVGNDTTIHDGSANVGNVSINGKGEADSASNPQHTSTITGLSNTKFDTTNVNQYKDSNRAATEGQLKDVYDLASKHSTVTVNGGGAGNLSLNTTQNENGGTNYDISLNDKITLGSGDEKKKVTIDGNQGEIKTGDITITGGDTDTISGLKNTTFDVTAAGDGKKGSSTAATEGQLQDVVDAGFALKDSQGQTVQQKLGQAIEIKDKDGNIITTADNTGKGLNLSLSNNLNIGGVGKDGQIGIHGADGKSGVGIDGKDGISVKGADGKAGVTITGINGKDGTEGHIGLTGAAGKDGKNATADIHVVSGQVGVDGTDGNGGKDGMDRISYTDHNNKPHEVATTEDGLKFAGDSGDALQQKLNSTTKIKGGADTTKLTDGNIGVVSDGKDTLTVKLSKDIKGLDSIEAKTVNAETVNSSTFNAGNTTINSSGLTVKSDDGSRTLTVQDGNVSMGGNQIHNVAPGTADDDAVNVSQLKKLGGEVSNVSRRVDRVGAGAAALAALHPQDFDPDDKWDFAVGYGNYRGANAAAVGAFYQPNEDTTLSVGGTVGGGENMVNAGISFKFGQGNHVTNSRVAMAKEILALKDFVEKQNTMLQQQNAKIEKLEAMVGAASGTPVEAAAVKPQKRTLLFPDVPENHWAYRYVKKLSERGLLEGYPDGEFKGNRTLTRYEFAAIVARALENGAAADEDMQHMAEEFDTEIRDLSLSRFRVDRVAGDDNDRHKIERVRVNDRDEEVQKKNGEKAKIYRDIYGEQIEKAAEAVK